MEVSVHIYMRLGLVFWKGKRRCLGVCVPTLSRLDASKAFDRVWTQTTWPQIVYSFCSCIFILSIPLVDLHNSFFNSPVIKEAKEWTTDQYFFILSIFSKLALTLISSGVGIKVCWFESTWIRIVLTQIAIPIHPDKKLYLKCYKDNSYVLFETSWWMFGN